MIPTITTLIINELKDILGHDPTKEELDSLSEYLGRTHIKFFVDLEAGIEDWKTFRTYKCPWCEKRYLESEMESVKADGTMFCSSQCEQCYKQEHGVAECAKE